MKHILHCAVDSEGRNWELFHPYVVFTVWKSPQVYTGFTLFNLLFGWWPRGLLNVAKVSDQLHEEDARRINQVGPIVKEHLLTVQQEENHIILEQIGQTNYHLQQPGKHLERQIYHINMPRCWVEPAFTLHASVSLSVEGPAESFKKGLVLTPAQQQELFKLEHQLHDVFSQEPGHTNILQHHIFPPPGVIIQQQPFRVPETRHQAIETKLSQMLQYGISKESISPWLSPIVVILKPDRSLCLCNTFRKLNEVLEFNGYPMP